METKQRGKLTIFEGLNASGRSEIASAYAEKEGALWLGFLPRHEENMEPNPANARIDWGGLVEVMSRGEEHIVLDRSWISRENLGSYPINRRVLERYAFRCATIVVHCRISASTAKEMGVSREDYLTDACLPLATSLPTMSTTNDNLGIFDSLRTMPHRQDEDTLGNIGAPIVVFHHGFDVPRSDGLADQMAAAFMREDKFLWVNVDQVPADRWKALANGGKVALITRAAHRPWHELMKARGLSPLAFENDLEAFVNWSRKVIEHPH